MRALRPGGAFLEIAGARAGLAIPRPPAGVGGAYVDVQRKTRSTIIVLDIRGFPHTQTNT
jgi:hypothetical protein